MTLRVYIAAPLLSEERAKQWATICRAYGFAVVSGWHDTVGKGAVDPTDPVVAAAIWLENKRDIDFADVMLVLADEGTPKTTYAELGIAAEQCKRVVCRVRPGSIPNCAYAPTVTRVTTDEELLNLLLAWTLAADVWATKEA